MVTLLKRTVISSSRKLAKSQYLPSMICNSGPFLKRHDIAGIGEQVSYHKYLHRMALSYNDVPVLAQERIVLHSNL